MAAIARDGLIARAGHGLTTTLTHRSRPDCDLGLQPLTLMSFRLTATAAILVERVMVNRRRLAEAARGDVTVDLLGSDVIKKVGLGGGGGVVGEEAMKMEGGEICGRVKSEKR